jgi:uncharacterized protein YcaQ
MLTISKETQRRFILGQQGLWPGRRRQGPDGVVEAVRAGAVVQVDPLNVVARSHDIVLYGRVRDYDPAHLAAALYTDRALFDYGGTVMIHPMEELPYWRVVMARKQREARRVAFAAEHGAAIDAVLAAVRERGPLAARDLEGEARRAPGSFRSGKVTSQALYYLWLAGALMTHSRRGFDRVYDLTERVAPPAYQHAASPEAADDFFMRKVFHKVGMATARSWRNWFAGAVERPVSPAEAAARLDALQAAGAIAPVTLADDKTPRFVLAATLPLLETLQAGVAPTAWQPVDATTEEEMTFLAPLEIVSTRGRAAPLFDFEYLWEVYKPAEKRRWGYYTLPILYGDRLVARLDPKLERARGALVVKGFWLEDHAVVDDRFVTALAAGLRRFMRFVGATSLDMSTLDPALRAGVEAGMLHHGDTENVEISA